MTPFVAVNGAVYTCRLHRALCDTVQLTASGNKVVNSAGTEYGAQRVRHNTDGSMDALKKLQNLPT